jgi:hypothetical protein
MRSRLIKGDTWVDVYREGIFGGRVKRLGPGDRTPIGRVGSIIVGPSATVIFASRNGREILKLPPLKLVPNLSELDLATSASHMRVDTAGI